MGGYVYMMSDRYRGGNLYRRCRGFGPTYRTAPERRSSKFVVKYAFHRLVYIEVFEDISDAIVREKRVKKWRREWKIDLIESMNPEWRDLSDEIHF